MGGLHVRRGELLHCLTGEAQGHHDLGSCARLAHKGRRLAKHLLRVGDHAHSDVAAVASPVGDRIRGPLGDIDPLNKVPLFKKSQKRVKKGFPFQGPPPLS